MEFGADRVLPQDHDDLTIHSARFLRTGSLPQTRLARFQIKSFEQEAVVFDTASGDTHLLAPLTAALFRIIKNNPGMTADEMRAALASQRSIGVGPDLADQTDEALASLRRIGLLETQ